MDPKELGLPEYDNYLRLSDGELYRRLHQGVAGDRKLSESERALIYVLLSGRQQRRLVFATWALVLFTAILCLVPFISNSIQKCQDTQRSAHSSVYWKLKAQGMTDEDIYKQAGFTEQEIRDYYVEQSKREGK